VAHLAPEEVRAAAAHDVDGDAVPVRHFGLVLAMDDWHALAERLRVAGTRFVIEPHVRFRGQPGEQATMFLRDPCGTRWSSRRSPTAPGCSRSRPARCKRRTCRNW